MTAKRFGCRVEMGASFPGQHKMNSSRTLAAHARRELLLIRANPECARTHTFREHRRALFNPHLALCVRVSVCICCKDKFRTNGWRSSHITSEHNSARRWQATLCVFANDAPKSVLTYTRTTHRDLLVQIIIPPPLRPTLPSSWLWRRIRHATRCRTNTTRTSVPDIIMRVRVERRFPEPSASFRPRNPGKVCIVLLLLGDVWAARASERLICT